MPGREGDVGTGDKEAEQKIDEEAMISKQGEVFMQGGGISLVLNV